ncbi:helix-turn-helix domain-containing protein [Hymenobacter jeollabukensis]|uniref:Helix-turn-helix domain-containing protein n=1 Tax=Hymenobacter jeollabukensis TaxID=2025313 RepID=A0A5R8WTS4_9BACT|nr:helix-turn-helix domain-containing protein [Hymenobacter jeollabukensis]TLM95170.1 helix-turn-helix domain-containing protein [Hymenobacter jeollabukensis]
MTHETAPPAGPISSHQDLNPQELKLRGFKAYAVDTSAGPSHDYRRRDFYKVALVTSPCTVHYADRSIDISTPSLMFANPHIPYSIELHDPRLTGYSCLFTEAFMKENDRSESLQQSPLFKVGGTPVFHLSPEQIVYVQGIFQKILAEQASDYLYKGDLIRTYLQLLIHEALRMQPSESFVQHKNASSRITSLFLELLERLFPVESPNQTMPLKTAQDFAQQLGVHVNHLNRAVKEVTGKPTTAHIAERIIGEAKALLHHTAWSTAEIAYSLGFEYPTYFSNFFRKHTATTPLAFRRDAGRVAEAS